jgi:hypothetical protein
MTVIFTPTITPTIPVEEVTATPTPDVVAQNIKAGLGKYRLIIFPNPVKGTSFRVAFESPKEAQAVVYFYTLKGEAVNSIKVAVQPGVNMVEQAANKMAAGIYIVKVVLDGDGNAIPAGKVAIIK